MNSVAIPTEGSIHACLYLYSDRIEEEMNGGLHITYPDVDETKTNCPDSTVVSLLKEPASMSTAPLKQRDTQYETDRIKAAVTFNETVSIFPIPNRSDYSASVKRCLWTDKRELQMNAARNMVEFAAEDFDWKNATEDDDMHLNHAGERVHPIHLWSEIHFPGNQLKPSKSLLKPIPQRPLHPSIMDDSWDPVARPPTPSPFCE